VVARRGPVARRGGVNLSALEHDPEKKRLRSSAVAIRGFGVELWVMRDGKIAIWQAAFNVARADQPPSVADLIR
jgi:hypothetical protein